MNAFSQVVGGCKFNFHKRTPKSQVVLGRTMIEHAKEIARDKHLHKAQVERESLLANAKSIVAEAERAGLIKLTHTMTFKIPSPDQVRAMAQKFCR